jgi:hypothetical protein
MRGEDGDDTRSPRASRHGASHAAPCENRDAMEPPDARPPRREAPTPADGASLDGGVRGPATPAGSLRERLLRDVRRGLRSGLHTFWVLARVMVPAYGVTVVRERLGVITGLAGLTRPLMSRLGLPGDAAVPLVVGYVLNIYAAVGSMSALDLSSRQVTVLAIAILIGHNLIVEGAVLHRAGMNGFAFGALRVVAGLAAGAVANVLMGWF